MQIYSRNGTRLNYLYLNVDDLSQDTSRMDDVEELVYIRLFYQYVNKLSLPSDIEKLRRIVRVRLSGEEEVKHAIEAFLALDGIVHSIEEPHTVRYALWDAIINGTVERFDRASANGTLAAKSRWEAQKKSLDVKDAEAA